MSFTKFKSKVTGLRTRVDLSKVALFNELAEGTELVFESGLVIVVSDSFQTVSNRAAGSGEVNSATEVPAAPVA